MGLWGYGAMFIKQSGWDFNCYLGYQKRISPVIALCRPGGGKGSDDLGISSDLSGMVSDTLALHLCQSVCSVGESGEGDPHSLIAS